AAFLTAQRPAMSISETENILVPVAQGAGLTELEVRWRSEVTMRRIQSEPNLYSPNLGRITELQRRRMKYNELGGFLERYNNMLPEVRRSLDAAAEAYRSAENPEAELRVLAAQYPRLSGDLTNRYFDLLMARQPLTLVVYSGDCKGQCAAAV